MVNVTPSVTINCSGLKKFGLHLDLVELSDMVIKKSIVIIIYVGYYVSDIVLRECEPFI